MARAQLAFLLVEPRHILRVAAIARGPNNLNFHWPVKRLPTLSFIDRKVKRNWHRSVEHYNTLLSHLIPDDDGLPPTQNATSPDSKKE